MASSSNAQAGRTLKRADPSTIQDKFLVGYQGWFTCPGDGKPLDPHHHGWLHWFTYPLPDGGRPNTDLWPDVSEYSPSELFPAPGLKYANGEQAFVFSSRNARTVERHFHWMALHGVDGAFLQRFLGQCDLEQGNEAIRSQRDEVGELVRQAAEKEGRAFAIMYDISGVAPDRIQRVLEKDWIHLLRDQRLLDSPNYLKEKGKPVVTLWGFGMSDQNHDPATVRAVTEFIRNNTPGGAYIVGGGPAHWRTSTSDADRNPEFVNVWLECFDAISPWTIGRYGDPAGADHFAEHNVKGDIELIKRRNEEAEQGVPNRRHIDYIPVILPGGSGFNLSEGKWEWNGIKRLGGRFLWRQLWNLKRLGVRTIYGAMWDEYDEGTAFMPVVSKKRQVPKHDKYEFMALDEDGYDLPPDWYMRIAGFIGEGLRDDRIIHETFPSKELDDYWSTRPRYEESQEASGSGTGKEKNQSWEEWQKWESEKGQDEPPPPPYSLEEDASGPREAPPLPPKTQIVLAPPGTTQAEAGPSLTHSAGPASTSGVSQGAPPTPPVASRPEVAAAAVGVAAGVGASNAGPSRSPERPSVPLASRPSLSRPPGSAGNGGPPGGHFQSTYTPPSGPPPTPGGHPESAYAPHSGPPPVPSGRFESTYTPPSGPPPGPRPESTYTPPNGPPPGVRPESTYAPPGHGPPPVSGARPESTYTPPSGPPPVPGRRPESTYTPGISVTSSHTGSSSSYFNSAAPGDVSSLADDFGRRASITGHSPTSPRFDAPPQHPSRPSSSRPTSPPSLRPTSAQNRPPSVGYRPLSTCANPAFPGYTPYQPSHTPPGDPHNPSSYPSYSASYARPASPGAAFPVPGFTPTPPASGGWSNAPWPPAEWGTPAPASPTNNAPYPYNAPQPYGAPYGSSSTSPPPLAPRPEPGYTPGGFAFPQAQTPYAPYGSSAPPAPYGSSAPPAPYGSSPAPPAPYGGTSYSSYPGGPPGAGRGHPPPPQRPPPQGWGAYPGAARPPPGQQQGFGGLLGGSGIASLAQTGLAQGEKLFNKLRK